jgi:hypothetical protein
MHATSGIVSLYRVKHVWTNIDTQHINRLNMQIQMLQTGTIAQFWIDYKIIRSYMFYYELFPFNAGTRLVS